MHTCVCPFFVLFCFLSGFSFTDTDDSQDSRGREGTNFYFTLPLPLAYEHWDIYLQFCEACEMLSATKLDETFPNQKFDMSNYKVLRRDRNGKGILFYINENILYKIIKDEYMRNEYIRNGIEMILFEFLVRTRKWFCVGIYKPRSQNENYFLDIFQRSSNM